MIKMLAWTGFWANAGWWIPVLILAIVGLAFFLFLLSTQKTFPYQRVESLCTETELDFYRELVEMVQGDFQIFGKTRIADLLQVKKGTKKRMVWQNRINSKHIDFVLCDPVDLRILVAIELDDRSHQRPDRVKRDEFVNQAFTDARLPILRIKTQKTYDRRKIRQIIDQVIRSDKKKTHSRKWVHHVD